MTIDSNSKTFTQRNKELANAADVPQRQRQNDAAWRSGMVAATMDPRQQRTRGSRGRLERRQNRPQRRWNPQIQDTQKELSLKKPAIQLRRTPTFPSPSSAAERPFSGPSALKSSPSSFYVVKSIDTHKSSLHFLSQSWAKVS
jgi:hypothetical protein